MQKYAKGILIGGVFTYLVNSLTEKGDKIWSKNQFGGEKNDHRQQPYIIFAECESRPWRSVTFDGEHHKLHLDVFCGDVSQVQAEAYAGKIISMLKGADFPLKGHVLIEIQHEQAKYIKKTDKNGYLVRLLFTVLTVCD